MSFTSRRVADVTSLPRRGVLQVRGTAAGGGVARHASLPCRAINRGEKSFEPSSGAVAGLSVVWDVDGRGGICGALATAALFSPAVLGRTVRARSKPAESSWGKLALGPCTCPHDVAIFKARLDVV